MFFSSALFNSRSGIYTLLLLLVISASLSACGQTGPLKLPEDDKQEQSQKE